MAGATLRDCAARSDSPGTYWIGVFTQEADDNTGYTLEASVI